jgi:hypothetical protein
MTPTSDDPDAARDRVAAALDRLSRINVQVIVVAAPDDVRLEARDQARSVAQAAGRSGLLEEATAAARDVAMRAFARGGFSGTWAATEMAASVASAEDRVATAAAFEEAAMAAVVEDLVDPATSETLMATVDELDQATGIPAPGSLSALTAPLGATARGRTRTVLQVAVLLLAWVVAATIGIGFGILVLAVAIGVFGHLARR